MTIPSLPERADVIVVGGGPAGLSAAFALRKAGVEHVLVLDREEAAGGIPRHCGHYPFGMREFHRLLRGPDYASRLVAAAAAAGVEIRTGVDVVALLDGPRLRVTSCEGMAELSARAVILATGVRETPRAARLIGGTKPGGVLNTGALQGLVYLRGMRPFRRPLILGTELVAFSALTTCAHAGIRPVAMVEPGTRATARWPAALYPRLRGVPLWLETELAAIEGSEQVTGAVLLTRGVERRVDCDGVIVTGDFRPEAALLAGSSLVRDPLTGGPEVDQYGRCSDPAYFAAGNLLRPVETAGWCWAEGRAVGNSVAAALAGRLPASGGQRIAVSGDGLKYVMPQRVAGAGSEPPALSTLQIRVRERHRGRLGLHLDGVEKAGRQVDALPERRLFLPLPTPGLSAEVRLTSN